MPAPPGRQLPNPGRKKGDPGKPAHIGMRDDGRAVQYHGAQHAQGATHSRNQEHPEYRRPERAKPVTPGYRRPPDADDMA